MWVHEFDDYTTTRTNTTQQSRLLSNNVYEITKAKELVTFLHAAAGYPVVDTWVKAIQNDQYATWPGLTSALVYKYLPKSDATVKGHMKHQRQNIRSTAIHTELEHETTIENRMNNVFAAIMDYRAEFFTDATWPFPVVSSLGNRYVFILYNYDSNYIMAEPVKDREKATTVAAYKKTIEHIEALWPKTKTSKIR